MPKSKGFSIAASPLARRLPGPHFRHPKAGCGPSCCGSPLPLQSLPRMLDVAGLLLGCQFIGRCGTGRVEREVV